MRRERAEVQVPPGAVVDALHMQAVRPGGVALLYWPRKRSYSLHSVDAEGVLLNGRYDLFDVERAMLLYTRAVADLLFRSRNSKTPSVNYLREAGEDGTD